jgi:hypothetical protein
MQTSPPTPLLAKERGVKSSPGLGSLPLVRGGLGRGQSTLLTCLLYFRTFKTTSQRIEPLAYLYAGTAGDRGIDVNYLWSELFVLNQALSHQGES